MKTLLINGYEKITKEGLTLHFNEKFSLNGGIAVDEWWLSWDKIGKAICGEKYCEATDVVELNKIRGIKAVPVEAEVSFAPLMEEIKKEFEEKFIEYEDGIGSVVDDKWKLWNWIEAKLTAT